VKIITQSNSETEQGSQENETIKKSMDMEEDKLLLNWHYKDIISEDFIDIFIVPV
jgi:hypothetical protein